MCFLFFYNISNRIKNDTLGKDARLERLDECANALGALLGDDCKQALTTLSELSARRSELLAARSQAIDAYHARQNELKFGNKGTSDNGSSSSSSAADALRDDVAGHLKIRLEKVDELEAKAVNNLKRKYLAMRMASDGDDNDDDDGGSSYNTELSD